MKAKETTQKVAFITGASRGIGKAAAIALANRGYDVVVTARTMKEGEGLINSSYGEVREVPVPGSLESTAHAVEQCGRRALPLYLDLLDRESIKAAVESVIDQWGRIDLLLNNACYQGRPLMHRMLELSADDLESVLLGNIVNQAYITQLVLPYMLSQKGGVIVNMASASGIMDPLGAPGEGGWGYAAGAGKGGFHRMAGSLHVEYESEGILAYNVEPGYTITESSEALMGSNSSFDVAYQGHPPETAANVIAWLATSEDAAQFAGQTVSSPTFFEEQGISQ